MAITEAPKINHRPARAPPDFVSTLER